MNSLFDPSYSLTMHTKASPKPSSSFAQGDGFVQQIQGLGEIKQYDGGKLNERFRDADVLQNCRKALPIAVCSVWQETTGADIQHNEVFSWQLSERSQKMPFSQDTSTTFL